MNHCITEQGTQERITIAARRQSIVCMDELRSVDIVIEDDAQLDVYAIQLMPPSTAAQRTKQLSLEKAPITQHTTWTLTLGEKAVARIFVGLFDSASLTINAILQGRGSAVEQRVLYCGSERQRMVLRLNSTHRGTETMSRILVRGAVLDHAHADFAGTIAIEQTGTGADGHLEHEGLLLSTHGRIDSLPGLEIGTDDVKASHSSAVHYLRPEQLFYLQTRGVAVPDAQRMIVDGFLSELLAMVKEPRMLDDIRAALEAKEQLISTV